jgi:hypothetical protein
MPPTTRAPAFTVTKTDAIRLLASPLRQAIVDLIVGRGALSVAELSELLGKPADRLYYHVKRLVAVGVLTEGEQQPTNGRPQTLFDVPARPVRLRYQPHSPTNRKAVQRVVDGMLRTARRDFSHGFVPGVEVEGPRRELWAARAEANLTPSELEKLNRILAQALDLMTAARGREHAPSGARPHQLTFVSSPGREP